MRKLTLRDRFNLFRFALRAAASPRGIVIPFGFGDRSSRARKYDQYAEEGFEQCAIVNACISLLMSGASSLRYDVKVDGDVVPEEDAPKTLLPLFGLLESANPQTSFTAHIEKHVLHKSIGGTTYTRKIGTGLDEKFGEPRGKTAPELWIIRPDLVTIKGRFGIITGYKFEGISEDIPPEEILLTKYEHPREHFIGLSPLASIEEEIDAFNEIVSWNKNLMKNSGVPAGMLLLKDVLSMTPEEEKKIRGEFRDNYEGAINAGSTFISSADSAEYIKLADKGSDLNWLEGKADISRFIANALKVPSVLVGDIEAKTYANYKEARKALYVDAVLPLVSAYIDGLNRWLLPDYGDNVELAINFEHIDVLREGTNELWERVDNSKELSPNEKRKLKGFEESTDSRAEQIPFQVITAAGNLVAGDPEAIAGESNENRETRASAQAEEDFLPHVSPRSFYRTLESRLAAGDTTERRRNAWQGVYETGLRGFWRGQSARVIDLLNDNREARQDEPSLPPPGLIQAIAKIDDLLTSEAEAAIYAQELAATQTAIVIEFGEAALVEVGEAIPFDTTRPAIEQFINVDLVKRGGLVNETTAAQIKDILTASAKAPIGSHQSRIRDINKLFNNELPAGRAKSIGRTEVGRASTKGTLEAYKQGSATLKEWITARDGGERHPSDGIDGQVVGIDENFTLGSGASGQAPFFMNDPAEDINCRCRIAALKPGEAPI